LIICIILKPILCNSILSIEYPACEFYCSHFSRLIGNKLENFNPFSISLGKYPFKMWIHPPLYTIVRYSSAETPGIYLNKTSTGDQTAAAVRTVRLRSSRVVFPDFCVPQVMRARDLPTRICPLLFSARCWPFLCPQGTLSRSGHCELRASGSFGVAWES